MENGASKGNHKRTASTPEDGPQRSQRLKLEAAGKEQVPASESESESECYCSSPSQFTHSAAFAIALQAAYRGASIRAYHDDAKPPKAHKRFTFLSFPAEIRNMIYEYSLGYPNSRQLYSCYYRRQLTAPHQPKTCGPWTPRLRAPTIILLNKCITNECLPMLRSRTLVIDRLPPPRALSDKDTALVRSCGDWSPDEANHFMQLSDFISPRTLQSIPSIKLNVGLCEGPLGSGWAWRPVIDELLDILTLTNACTKLCLLIRLCNTHEEPIAWHSDQTYLAYFMKKLKRFADLNPNVFAQREIKCDVWKIRGEKARYVSSNTYPELVRVHDDGTTVVVDENGDALPRDDNWTAPRPRRYPDKEMFPGSVMQFAKGVTSVYYDDDDDSD